MIEGRRPNPERVKDELDWLVPHIKWARDVIDSPNDHDPDMVALAAQTVRRENSERTQWLPAAYALAAAGEIVDEYGKNYENLFSTEQGEK